MHEVALTGLLNWAGGAYDLPGVFRSVEKGEV